MSDETRLPYLGFYREVTHLDAQAVEAVIADAKALLLEDIRGRAEAWRAAGDPSAPLDLSALGATIPLALTQALDALADADSPAATVGAKNLDLSNNNLEPVDLAAIVARLEPTGLTLSNCGLTTLQRLDPMLMRLWLSQKLVGLEDNPLPEDDRAVLRTIRSSAPMAWSGKPPANTKLPASRADAWLGYPRWAAWADEGSDSDSRKDAIQRVVGWIVAGDVDATLDLSGLGLTSLPPDLPATVFKTDIKGNALQRLDPFLVELAIAHGEIGGEDDSLRPEDLKVVATMRNTANQSWSSEDDDKVKFLPLSRREAWRAYPAWSAWADAAGAPEEQRREVVDRLGKWVAAGNVDAALDLSGLGLTGLPPGLPDTVVRLNLARNSLDRLDQRLPPDLRELIADNNRLAAFPSAHVLRLFSIAQNGLTRTPPSLPATIEALDLSDNAIDRVDEALLSFWLSGGKVDIEGNPFSKADKAALDLMKRTKADSWQGVPKNETRRRSILHITGKPADMGGSKAEAWQGYAAWSEWAGAKSSDGERRGEAMRRIMDWTADGNISRPLDLSGLGLTSLPPQLPARTLILKLDRNRLSGSVDQMGKALDHLKLATEISLTHNELRSLPPLGENWKILHADDNAIETLGDTLPPKLLEITLRNNLLKDLGKSLPLSVRKIDARSNPIAAVDGDVMSLQISGCQLDIDDKPLNQADRILVAALGKAASSKLPAYRVQKDLLIGGQDISDLFETLQTAKDSLAAIDFSRTTRFDGPIRKQGAKVAAVAGKEIDDTARQQLNERIRSIETAKLDRIVTTRIGYLLDDLEPKLQLLEEAYDRAIPAVDRLEAEIDEYLADIRDRYKSVEKLCQAARSAREEAKKAEQLIDPDVIGRSLPDYDTGRWITAREIWETCATGPLLRRLADINTRLPPEPKNKKARPRP